MGKDLTDGITESQAAKQASKQASKRIPQLEGLRFIAICIIILSHFEFLSNSEIWGDFYTTHLHNATLAVDYFFMLSGFGIYLSSKRPECTFIGAVRFAINKIRKIYPLYIFSLMLGCIWMFQILGCSIKTAAKNVFFS